MKKVNVQALEVRKGKKQHLVAGKVYEVTEELSKALINSGQATKAKSDMKVGETYKLSAAKKKSTTPPSIED